MEVAVDVARDGATRYVSTRFEGEMRPMQVPEFGWG